MLRKSGKIIRIIMVGVMVAWFGMQMSPRPHEAAATVFDKIFSYTQNMPDYMGDPDRSREPRKVRVNGNQTYLTVQKGEGEVSDILDFYARKYNPLPPQPLAGGAKSRQGEKLSELHQLLDCLKADQQFRFQREGYGFLGVFEFHDRGLKTGSCEFKDALAKAMKNGDIGKLGTFRITMAFTAGNDRGNPTIINIWTDEAFDLGTFSRDASGDMPGKDIEDVPRFSGAVRQLSIEQENEHTMDQVAVYEAQASVSRHILFYHSMMKNSGWTAHEVFENKMKAEGLDHIMYYKRKGRECTISVDENAASAMTVTTIMARNQKNG